MNDIHFEHTDLLLISKMIKVLNISFDDTRPAHINMIKALYYQFFVMGDKSKGIIFFHNKMREILVS